jgi:hypothetical protein
MDRCLTLTVYINAHFMRQGSPGNTPQLCCERGGVPPSGRFA